MFLPAFLIRTAPTSFHQWYLKRARNKLRGLEDELTSLERILRDGIDYNANNPDVRDFVSSLLHRRDDLNKQRWTLTSYINKIIQPYE